LRPRRCPSRHSTSLTTLNSKSWEEQRRFVGLLKILYPAD
jgi:hypothetical protein